MKKAFLFFCLLMLVGLSFTVTNSSPAKSNVTFTFDGLQVLAFGNPTRVSTGILDVHHHEPKIEIKEITNGKEKVLETISGKQLQNKVLNISVPNNAVKPTRYISPNMNVDKKDFRWCLDMEQDLFQKQLYLKEDKLAVKIHFANGDFFTNSVTSDKYQFFAGSTQHPFKREIGQPAARIELQQGNSLTIAGLDKELNLAYQSGVSYKVDITNLPPKEMANIDHFAFYYDVIKEPVTRFVPIQVKKAGYLPPPTVCDPSVFSKSKIN